MKTAYCSSKHRKIMGPLLLSVILTILIMKPLSCRKTLRKERVRSKRKSWMNFQKRTIMRTQKRTRGKRCPKMMKVLSKSKLRIYSSIWTINIRRKNRKIIPRSLITQERVYKVSKNYHRIEALLLQVAKLTQHQKK